jgi:hypothetical protein
MKRKSTIITLALLLVFGTAFAQMQGKGRNTSMMQGWKGENCQILTDDEREKVADAKRDFEKIAIPLRADIRVLKMELDDLVLAGKSGKELTSKLDELNAAKAKLSEERLAHQVDVRKIVGEDKYKEMHMFKQHMMHNKMGGQRGGKKGGNMKAGMGQGECRYPDGPRYK